MIKIWGRPSAYNVQKVLWCLNEIGVEYENIHIGGSLGGLDSPEFLTKNPNGRIPVLEVDNHIIWESNSIIRFLAATYSYGQLWSLDPFERSLAERWMDWELASLQPDFLDLFWGFYRTPVEHQDAEFITKSAVHCENRFNVLNSHLATNRFVAGEHFSMGDIAVATGLYRYFEMGISTPAIPHVRRWYQELCERLAYQKTIMVPFIALFGKQTF
nr:glutathione S-transferase [uncultured Tolumonas sp.]